MKFRRMIGGVSVPIESVPIEGVVSVPIGGVVAVPWKFASTDRPKPK